MKKFLGILLIVVFVMVVTTGIVSTFKSYARAAELHVDDDWPDSEDTDGDNEYAHIQAAIDAAIDGDTIIVADGTYTGLGNKDLDFKGKAITVISKNGAENTIIDCEGGWEGILFP